jgi:hypothetical protein
MLVMRLRLRLPLPCLTDRQTAAAAARAAKPGECQETAGLKNSHDAAEKGTRTTRAQHNASSWVNSSCGGA